MRNKISSQRKYHLTDNTKMALLRTNRTTYILSIQDTPDLASFDPIDKEIRLDA